MHINRNPSKIFMFGRDGPECRGDPVDAQRSGLKNDISELDRFREVDTNWTNRVTCK